MSADQALLTGRRPIATATMLAEALGKGRQSVTKALKHPCAPPSTPSSLGPLYDQEDGLRYLRHLKHGRKIVPAEQYGYDGADPELRLPEAQMLTALAALQEPWHPAPPGRHATGDGFDADGYLGLGDAAVLAHRSTSLASARLADPALLDRFGVGFVQLRNLRVYYPAQSVIDLIAEQRETGTGNWPVDRRRYEPPRTVRPRAPKKGRGRRGSAGKVASAR